MIHILELKMPRALNLFSLKYNMQYPFQTEELKEEEESFDKVELSEEVELAAEELSSSLIEGTKPME